MVASNPNVARNSPVQTPTPVRALSEAANADSPNMICASQTPTNPPASCAATYAVDATIEISRRQKEPQGNRRVEVRARDRAIDQNQYGEDGTRRERVAEQRDGIVASGQGLAHDARPHHGDQ